MKTRFFFIGLGICASTILTIILVSFTPKSPADLGNIAIMRIYESADDNASRIIISCDNYKHQEIDLWGYRQSYTDEWLDNADSIASTINSLKKKGYEIISTSAAGNINSFKDIQLTTYIFEKKR